MNEKTIRLIVFFVFVVTAIIVICLGVLLAVYNYVSAMNDKDRVLRDWKLHTCCYGTCEHGDEGLDTCFVVITTTVSLGIVLVALAVAIFLYMTGHDYYRCGRFECPEENNTRREE
ncbi:MAG: hypothetical protein JHC26_08615 [Thermofilum sp.]|jgi:hypothetical protein|uniref:hypothetical protein n=1 Tax=Thermofilum sp. TaxID=1961369 RepID=UPI00258CF49C|nr:hypothetical protein [Thermofilum sp.]MCI4409139.1 hypothetical protein [Thermofilum sp.]